jgi:Family of unknown function (DUF6585)
MTQNHAMNTVRLGGLVKEYKSSSASRAKLIVVSLVCILISSIFFLGAVSERSAREWGGVVALSIIGSLFLLPLFAAIYVSIRGRGASLSLYEHGLSFRRGGKESTAAWDEIDSYMQESACRINTKDGEVIEFGQGLTDADEIAQKIQEETLKLMLPQVQLAIRNGSTVAFKGWKPADKIPLGLLGNGLSNYMEAHSGFTVDQNGVTEIDGGGRIHWKDMTGFGISAETRGPRIQIPVNILYLADANHSFRTRYGLLPNAHVLLALCAEMTIEKTNS